LISALILIGLAAGMLAVRHSRAAPAGGAYRVKDILEGHHSSFPSSLTAVGATLFFLADNGLWRSDGTADGTQPLKQFVLAASGLVEHAGVLYFSADDGSTGIELGAPAGPHRVLIPLAGNGC
jgi:large repetitive protein